MSQPDVCQIPPPSPFLSTSFILFSSFVPPLSTHTLVSSLNVSPQVTYEKQDGTSSRHSRKQTVTQVDSRCTLLACNERLQLKVILVIYQL